MVKLSDWLDREMKLLKESGRERHMHAISHLTYLVADIIDEGHSGASMSYRRSQIGTYVERMLSYTPLTPLTGEEDEWGTDAGDNQNNRCFSVFKNEDGTVTHQDYLVTDRKGFNVGGGNIRDQVAALRGYDNVVTFPYEVAADKYKPHYDYDLLQKGILFDTNIFDKEDQIKQIIDLLVSEKIEAEEVDRRMRESGSQDDYWAGVSRGTNDVLDKLIKLFTAEEE